MSGSPFAGLPLHSAGVVLADPAWSFVTYSPKGWRKSAHAHYSCMDLAEIQAMPVADLAAPESVLVLWSTQVHLLHAIAVLEGLGVHLQDDGRLGQAIEHRSVLAVRHRLSAALGGGVLPDRHARTPAAALA